MKVETQAQADSINSAGIVGPFRAANGHLMLYNARFPRDTEATPEIGWDGRIWPKNRDYRVGDTILYDQFDAWCSAECRHDAPPEDW